MVQRWHCEILTENSKNPFDFLIPEKEIHDKKKVNVTSF